MMFVPAACFEVECTTKKPASKGGLFYSVASQSRPLDQFVLLDELDPPSAPAMIAMPIAPAINGPTPTAEPCELTVGRLRQASFSALAGTEQSIS